MQATIDKLTTDKKHLSEVLTDREQELRRLNDPRNLKELKQLLNELDDNIAHVDNEKNKQYQEMQTLLGIMGVYQKEYQQKELSKKGLYTIKLP